MQLPQGTWSHLSIRVKSQAGHAMCVDVSKDGHSLHPVRVPDTDEWVLTHLTRCDLDLIWMDGQTDGDQVRNKEVRNRHVRETDR